MERRGQDRDLGFNPDSPLKLPLAPILSTPPDRRGTAAAAAPTRRGSAIFSPTQTLDHPHHLLPHNNRHHLSPQQLRPPPPQLKEPSPDPDPSTPTHDGPSNSRTPPSPSPPLPPPPAAAAEAPSSGVRYRECLKNHAASMGGHVVDGCGEFMPNGEDGTAEALRCAACDCHRNFHRKESDGESHQPPPPTSYRTTLTSPALAAAAHHHSQSAGAGAGAGFSSAAPAMVSFGGGGTGEESSSEDLAMFQSSGGGHAGSQPSYSGSRKRFRTKFSQEQKDRMQEVAERLGWRIQKQDEQLVQQLCQETGIKRQVFKVWMHNNKQAMKKKQI